MTSWTVLVPALAVAAAFWLPGLVVARLARLPLLVQLAAAPALTLGVAGTVALASGLGGLPWSSMWALAGTTVLALLVLAARGPDRAVPGVATAPRATRARRALVRRRAWLGASIAAGVLVQVVPVLVGAGRPHRLLTAFDAVAHDAMLAYVRRTGDASSLTITAAHTTDGSTQGFYGAAWHAVTALVPAWPDAPTVLNAAVVVPTAAAWTLGLAALTGVVFPRRPRARCWAALLSCAGISVPLYLALRPEGMIPNALGVALVPGLVALVVGRDGPSAAPRALLVAAAGAGVALTHPNAALSAVVVLAPWVVVSAGARARGALTAAGRSRQRVVLVTSVVATVVGVVGVLGSVLAEPFTRVVAVTPEEPVPLGQAALTLLGGDTTGMGHASGSVVVLAAAVGLVLSRRSPSGRRLAWSVAAMAALHLAATSAVPLLTDVDRLWYGEPRRFAPVLSAVLVPFAARTLDVLSSALWVARARGTLRRSAHGRALVAGVLVVTSTVPAAWALTGLARVTYAGTVEEGLPPLADDAELAMMHRAASTLDPAAGVLGSSFAGAAHLSSLYGQRVVPPTYLTVEGADLRLVHEHLGELGTSDELCDALERLGVRYLYVDAHPWNERPTHVDVREAPARGVELVDRGGSASIYEITAC